MTATPASAPGRLAALLARAGPDWFLLALLGAVALAWWQPQWGSPASPLPWKPVTTVGVALVFFFYGLKMSADKLRAGLRNWRLHVLIQLSTFALFPALALLARPFFSSPEGVLLWQSLFFLGALPSTVSTSVVMVSIAGGNLPAAIFNASISSFLGLLLTPFLVSLVLPARAGSVELSGMVGQLLAQVALPVAGGVVLNPRLGGWAGRHTTGLRGFDQVIILLIVFTAFSNSFAEGIFGQFELADMLRLGAGLVGLYLVVCAAIWGAGRLLRFNRADRIAAVFCGSKKSLVQGSVLASVLFPAGAGTGLLLLPVLLYHALQIVLASSMAQWLGRQPEAVVSKGVAEN